MWRVRTRCRDESAVVLHATRPGGRVSNPETTHNRLLQNLANADPAAYKRLLRELRQPLSQLRTAGIIAINRA